MPNPVETKTWIFSTDDKKQLVLNKDANPIFEPSITSPYTYSGPGLGDSGGPLWISKGTGSIRSEVLVAILAGVKGKSSISPLEPKPSKYSGRSVKISSSIIKWIREMD